MKKYVYFYILVLVFTICGGFFWPTGSVSAFSRIQIQVKKDRILNTFHKAISPVCLPTEEGKGSKYENVAAVVSGIFKHKND